MDKIKRATEIYRTMTPHQMALRIVELEDGVSEIVEQAVSEHARQVNELKDALELAEWTVLAKQQAVPEGWQLVPVEPTPGMCLAGVVSQSEKLKRYALGGSLPPIDHGMPDAYSAMLSAAPKYEGGAA